MKNKVRLIVLISILVIALAVGVFLLLNNKSKADTLNQASNKSLLSGLVVNNDSSSGAIIKLSDKFTDSQISSALLGAGAKTRSGQDDAILQEIRQKAKDLANQPVKGQDTTRTIGQEKFVGDLIIDVRNSKGEQITSLATRAVDPKPATVPDNFDFDVSVPLVLQQFYIDAYPKIEAIYGPRSDNRKIKIYYDANLTRGWYSPYLSEIHSDIGFMTNRQRAVHELVHAFHGIYCLVSIWEEGMAQTISYYIMRNSYGEPYTDFGGAYYYEFKNDLSDDFSERDGAWTYMRPYLFGQVVFDKILLENKNFFKNFNQLLYQENSGTIHSNYSQLIELANQTMPKIENQVTADWFSRQIAFLPVNANYFNQSFIGFNENFYVDDDLVGFASGSYSDNFPTEIKSFNIKGYSNANELKVECDIANPGPYLRFQFSSCRNPFKDLNYEGAMKFVITIDNDASKISTEYALVSPRSRVASVSGLVRSTNNPTSIKLTNIDTNWSTSAIIKDGAFYVDDKTAGVAGRFKVDLLDVSGKVLKIQYFNKFNSFYQVLILDTPNDCSPKSWQANGIAGGVNVSADFNKICFNTLFINSIPVERSSTNNYQAKISGLLPKMPYNVALSYTSDGANIIRSAIKTVNTLDLLKVIKEENIGVASEGSFRRRVTFNYPIDISYVSQISDKDANFVASVNITKVDNLTYDFVPDKALLDDHEYKMTYVYIRISDGYGLLNNQYVNYSYFTTPVVTVMPKVTTLAPTGIAANAVLPHGNITDAGGLTVTKRGFQITRIKGTPQSDYADTGSFGAGEFTKTNVSLYFANTTYYVRAYATNSKGTTYGDWVEFKTLPPATVPKVTTLAPTGITANGILPHGNITDAGNLTVTKRGFQITRIKGTSQADYADTGSFGSGEFTKTNISLYFANTIYYVRAYAINSKGTTYGDWVEFKTLSK